MDKQLVPPYAKTRHVIVNKAIQGLDQLPFELSYIFAWHINVYPILDTSIVAHKPYGYDFEVSQSQMNDLIYYLDTAYANQEFVTFWQLEDLFEADKLQMWDRDRLINACRYLYMKRTYSRSFWQSLLAFMPEESITHMITKQFSHDELGFTWGCLVA